MARTAVGDVRRPALVVASVPHVARAVVARRVGLRGSPGGMEDLRRAERYGVQSALLRAGFKALPSQTAPTMRAEDAAEAIAF